MSTPTTRILGEVRRDYGTCDLSINEDQVKTARTIGELARGLVGKLAEVVNTATKGGAEAIKSKADLS